MITGTVKSSNLNQGVYIVIDDMGRKYRASSVEVWRCGDRVNVLEGHIVGGAGNPAPVRVFSV